MATGPLPEWLDPTVPKQLANQTDRGCAIIGGALVEHYLEKLLLARMRSDLSNKRKEAISRIQERPLGNFQPKLKWLMR